MYYSAIINEYGDYSFLKPQLGQYYFSPHRNWWGVWQYTSVSATGACGSFVKDFRDIEEAREFVWKANGWGTSKSALKMN
jgi:hypothetical protein